MYLNVSCFLDGLNQLQLQQNVVRPVVRPRHRAYDDVNLFQGIDKAPVIGKRAFDEAGSSLLEGEQHLCLVNVQAHLWPMKNVGSMALG